MIKSLRIFMLALLFAGLTPVSSFAVLPDEILADAALEARARAISAGLRCLVCQNQSIDDSDADLARDLRILVRERLVAGETDDEVVSYVVSRYGEFVLLQPQFNIRNALLWAAPLLLLLIGAVLILRRSRGASMRKPGPLSDEEKCQLEGVLGE